MEPLITLGTDSITLTDRATNFVRRLLRMSGAGPQAGLRLQVSPGGCSGLNSTFEVSDSPSEREESLRFAGVTLFVDPPSKALLAGATIDFAESATQTGFVIQVRAGNACGCAS